LIGIAVKGDDANSGGEESFTDEAIVEGDEGGYFGIKDGVGGSIVVDITNG
jgi:hypothetical protein